MTASLGRPPRGGSPEGRGGGGGLRPDQQVLCCSPLLVTPSGLCPLKRWQGGRRSKAAAARRSFESRWRPGGPRAAHGTQQLPTLCGAPAAHICCTISFPRPHTAPSMFGTLSAHNAAFLHDYRPGPRASCSQRLAACTPSALQLSVEEDWLACQGGQVDQHHATAARAAAAVVGHRHDARRHAALSLHQRGGKLGLASREEDVGSGAQDEWVGIKVWVGGQGVGGGGRQVAPAQQLLQDDAPVFNLRVSAGK